MTRVLALAVVVTVVAIVAGWRPWEQPDRPPASPDARPSASPSSSGAPAGSPSPSPPASLTRADPPPTPRPGACHRLSYDEAVAPTVEDRPVPCAQEHTAVTYLVGRLDTVVDGHLVAVDSERVRDQVARTCPARFARQVGGTVEQRRLSLLRPVWFTPTVEESDAGARWFRCDVVALARHRTLAPLSGSLAGVLHEQAGRERYGLCATAEPGTPAFERVICSIRHSWRAVRTVPLPGTSYPGVRAVRRAGEGPCRAAGRAAAGNRLDFRWGYEWPTAQQWRTGRTYGICWVPD
jgi:hypothetical protein